jgi:restriction endonuclease S subunit
MSSPLKLENRNTGWVVEKLGLILELLKDGTHGSHERLESGIPMLSAKDITKDGRISLDNNPSLVSEEDYRSIHGSYVIQYGDILLTVVGTLGRCAVCIVEDKFTIQRSVAVLRVNNKKIDALYLSYVIASGWFQNQLQLRSNATAQAGVYLGELANIEVTYPSNIVQQQKIAKILSTVDKLIEKTQTLIDKYTAIKQGMMADLFTRGIDMTTGDTPNSKGSKLRPSIEDAPELYKQTELGWVPKEWKVAYLGDCCEVHNNRRKPISAEEREKVKGDFPYYGCTKVLDYIDEYRLDGKYVIIGEDGDHFLKFARQEMTILIEGKFNVNNHAHVVAGTERCLTEWFHFYYVHRDITYYLTRQGAGRFKLKKETLLELPMLLPPISEQKAIYSRYLAINEKQSKERTSLIKYKKIKKGLMQDLLSGSVRVN